MKRIIHIAACGLVCTLAHGGGVTKAPVKGDALVMRWTNAQELNTTKEAEEKLMELQMINDQATAEVQRLQDKLRQAEQEFTGKRSTLSKAARETEEAKLVALKSELSSLIETSKLKVSRAVQEKTEEMVAAVEDAARKVAEKQGIDVIMDTVSGRTLYVSNKAMVTQDLVKEMNAQNELKTAKGKDTKSAQKSHVKA